MSCFNATFRQFTDNQPEARTDILSDVHCSVEVAMGISTEAGKYFLGSAAKLYVL
jgi:hypothetical protein